MHEAYPAVAKYYLHKRGLNISTVTRTMPGILSGEVKKNIDSLFDEYAILKEEIGI